MRIRVYPGQYYDKETGLHYNYFRDYNPGIGRYIESDPIGLKGGINLYLYAGANPTNLHDAFGLKCDSGECPDCPGGIWRVNFGYSSRLTVIVGAGSERMTFTCVSNSKQVEGIADCHIIGLMVQVQPAAYSFDVEGDEDDIGGGNEISYYPCIEQLKGYTYSYFDLDLIWGSVDSVTNTITPDVGIGFGFSWIRCDVDSLF